jgi:choline dehydrogenase-like flavoprotein
MGLLLGLLSSITTTTDDDSDTTTPPFTVALVERGYGDAAAATTTQHLHRWCAASHEPNNSNCLTAAHLHSRLVDVAVGCGLGGTTLINAGLVIPPAAADFHQWPMDISGTILQSVDTVITAMHSNQCIVHSTREPQTSLPTNLPTVMPTDQLPWKETTFPSCCIHVPCAATVTEHGTIQRASYYESLVQPLLDQYPALHDCLTLFTGYSAERLLFDTTNNVCTTTGVEVTSAITGARHEIAAARDVILSAGAVESPALLLASGIGRAVDLEAIGVTAPIVLVNDSTASSSGFVGGNLRDHILLPRVMLTKPRRQPVSLNGVQSVSNMILQTDDSTTTTKAQISLMDSAAYTDLVPIMMATALRFYMDPNTTRLPKPLVGMINLQLRFLFLAVKLLLHVLVVYTPVYFLLRYCVAVMAVFLMNAESVGQISVKRKDPSSSTSRIVRRSDLVVDIDLGYLSRDDDVVRLMESWKASDTAYPDVGVGLFPGPLIYTAGGELHAGRFAVFARAMVRPYFHWMGTCAMQQRRDKNNNTDNDDWVVDAEFRVRGVQSLRVCDASVFPTLISAPPALTCAALGHVLAAKLLANESKK